MKKHTLLRTLLLLLCGALLSVGFAVGAAAEDTEDWNLVNYEFDEVPSGVINEGTVTNGVLTLAKNGNGNAASFYTAQAGKAETVIYSEIAVKAVSGWVNIHFTNKISAQGYRIQVRADGEVHIFGGSSNAHIDLIGKYDTTGFCKLSVTLDLDEDVFRVSINDGEVKEYNATMSAFYTSNNTDARGYRRVLVVGNTPDSIAEVDYIRVMVPAVPETSTDEESTTEPPATTPEATTPATTDAPNTTGSEPSVTTDGAQDGETKPDNTGLIIGVAAAVVVVIAVVAVVLLKKRK